MKAGYQFVNKDDPEKAVNEAQAKEATEFLEGRNLEDGYTFTTLKDLWVRDIEVAGNSYFNFLKNSGGQALGLGVADPRTMAVVADEFGNIKKYVQRTFGYDPIEFEKEEVIHSVMDYSTANALLGVSPIESIVYEARAEMSASMMNWYFYENNAVPSHLFIIEEDISEDNYKELKKEIDLQFKGSKNAFKSGVIPHVKDIKTIVPSQKEMQYIETRKFTTSKVVVAFGVDKFILGYTEKVQRGNADVIYSMFYNETIRPYELYLEEIINQRVLPELFGDAVQISFQIIESNYENDYKIADSTRADVQAGILTANEARQKRGLDKHENEMADELMFNGMLLDDLDEEFAQAVKDIEAINK